MDQRLSLSSFAKGRAAAEQGGLVKGFEEAARSKILESKESAEETQASAGLGGKQPADAGLVGKQEEVPHVLASASFGESMVERNPPHNFGDPYPAGVDPDPFSDTSTDVNAAPDNTRVDRVDPDPFSDTSTDVNAAPGNTRVDRVDPDPFADASTDANAGPEKNVPEEQDLNPDAVRAAAAKNGQHRRRRSVPQHDNHNRLSRRAIVFLVLMLVASIFACIWFFYVYCEEADNGSDADSSEAGSEPWARPSKQAKSLLPPELRRKVEHIIKQAAWAIASSDYAAFYDRLDVNGTGRLERDEFRDVVRRVLRISILEISDSEIYALYAALDCAKAGSIDIEELLIVAGMEPKPNQRDFEASLSSSAPPPWRRGQQAYSRFQPLPVHGLFSHTPYRTLHIGGSPEELLCGRPVVGYSRLNVWPHDRAHICQTCHRHWNEWARRENQNALVQLGSDIEGENVLGGDEDALYEGSQNHDRFVVGSRIVVSKTISCRYAEGAKWNYKLKVGMEGRVESVDAHGDALVSWSGLGRKWLLRHHLRDVVVVDSPGREAPPSRRRKDVRMPVLRRLENEQRAAASAGERLRQKDPVVVAKANGSRPNGKADESRLQGPDSARSSLASWLDPCASRPPSPRRAGVLGASGCLGDRASKARQWKAKQDRRSWAPCFEGVEEGSEGKSSSRPRSGPERSPLPDFAGRHNFIDSGSSAGGDLDAPSLDLWNAPASSPHRSRR
jgi:hypothetical protein